MGVGDVVVTKLMILLGPWGEGCDEVADWDSCQTEVPSTEAAEG